MEITSLQNAQVKKWARLKQKKYREAEGRFLIEGMHLVEEAGKAGLLTHILCTKETVPPCTDIPCTHVTRAILDKITGSVSGSDIAAICRFPDRSDENASRWILLDRIQDPGNLGTIIRSAYAFGYDTILLSEGCADPYNEKVIRSTQGALFHLCIRSCSLPDAVNDLKQRGVPIYATALHKDSIPLAQLSVPDTFAVLFGNEGQGVSEELLAMSDATLFIEMERFESLNVAVAAGITLYKMKQKRLP